MENWRIVKNPHLLSNPYETLWKWLPHELIIFTKFHKDRTKNVDFLLMVNFWTCLVFFPQTLHFTKNLWLFKNLLFSGKDSCGGDSGGPLVWREFAGEPWNQIGLVSYGTPKCGKGVPAVYTKIESYLDWIEENMEP